jgi:hypothetical protein
LCIKGHCDNDTVQGQHCNDRDDENEDASGLLSYPVEVTLQVKEYLLHKLFFLRNHSNVSNVSKQKNFTPVRPKYVPKKIVTILLHTLKTM